MALVSRTEHIGYGERHSSSLNRKQMNLPRIEHPSKRIDDDDTSSLDVRGRSRDGHGDGQLIRNEQTTPRIRRSSSLKYHSKPYKYLPDISENRDNVYLPIFGQPAESSTSSSNYQKDRETPRTSKIIVDELEATLRDKVRSQLHDVRTKFRHASQNDPNGKINRQALQHLISTIFGTQRQISPSQIDKLLERLNLKHSNKITFDEFLQSIFNGEEALPEWVSRQISPRQDSSSKRTASQMFLILKEKVRTKHKDIVNLCPSLDGGRPSRIFKAQFYNSLMDMGYRMKDTEFDKLWDKFDTDGYKAVNCDKFLKILTNEAVGEENTLLINEEQFDDEPISPTPRNIRSSHSDSELKTPRSNTARSQLDENQIQKWLNHKFPQGYSQLEIALERLDTKQMGTLPRDRFLEELKRFGLKLEPHLLDFFLKRLNIDLTLTNDGVPYRDVINAFKQRSDPTKKRLNADNQLPPEENRQTQLERHIDYVLAMNYERVRDLFRRLDNAHNGTISGNELRSVVEDLIEYTLKPDEYYQLLKQMPMNEHGRIKYKEYLKQILDRSLQLQENPQKTSKNSQWDFIKPANSRLNLNQQQLKIKQEEKTNQFHEDSKNFNDEDDKQPIRSIDELCSIVKSIIRNRYKDIEDEFKKLDRSSYGELTQDLLYDLFRRLSIRPEINHREIDLLWSRCHLKENGHLDFYQFLREFGYSKRSAHYPNAKQNPPKRGDADFLLTSRKLYGDSVLVHGAALNAIKSNWDGLRREFAELDPYRTGYVQLEEFDDILTELCPAVNQEDLDILRSRFQTPNDSRMNYVRFLKHHAPLPELIGLIDEPNKSSLATINEKSPRAPSDRSILTQVCNKLRRKLSDSFKQLRRTFKQQDITNSGSVPVKTFKEILHQYKCILNDEEFYTLTSQIDTKMDGTINYNYFLQQYVKNN